MSTLDVWLSGRFAGQLHRGQNDHVEFIYDENYTRQTSATPLSLSIPTSRLAHDYKTTEHWLDNLLPEDEETRVRWARRFGETRTDPFTLLSHMGVDAPGAVQIVREGIEPSSVGSYEELSEIEIATRLREIRGSKRGWVPGPEGDIHYSLAGQQSKFAIVREGGVWLEPTGASASTS